MSSLFVLEANAMPIMGKKMLELYHQLDNHIMTHYNSPKQKQAPCAKGCASCCSQFFEISTIEFLVILNQLKTIESDLLETFQENSKVLMSLFKEYHHNFFESYFNDSSPNSVNQTYYQHPERFKIHFPCVFLSKEGACQIYPVRPFVCRTTGVGYKRRFEWGPICNEIHNGFLASFWQVDLRKFLPEIDAISWGVSLRQYPMFYFMFEYFTNHSNPFTNSLLKSCFEDSEVDFLEKLKERK
jgi:Fe-S-cluster containining protein